MIPTTESGRLFPGGRIDKGSGVCYNLVTYLNCKGEFFMAETKSFTYM